MKGFKSFADPTTLEFGPGVTVVVGPNGSGKSNVVDAIAWVLGAQGPSVVRSQKMDDVIFAGTAKRAALGRAEVILVLDNSSRRLPLDLNEVTISRTLFRSGDSEYALNGVECRLLDVQELLSDSGVGRQQHSLIGQGQLDSVLQARPEERRMIIEEAAGILKFRRRRERAVRRLDAAEESLVRLSDLLREVRRQLRPLERQAESAARHDALEAELRAVSLYLSGRELSELSAKISDGERRLREDAGESERLAQQREELAVRLNLAEDELGSDPTEALSVTISRLERLEERAKGLGALISQRRRAAASLIAALDDVGAGPELEEVAAQLRTALEEVAESAAEHGATAEALHAEEQALALAEAAYAAQFASHSGAAAQQAALASAALKERRDALQVANSHAAAAFERRRSLASRRDEVAKACEEAAAALRAASEESEALRAPARAAEEVLGRSRAALQSSEEALSRLNEERLGLLGRQEALSIALEEIRERAGAERLAGISGVLGPFVELVEVDEEAATAFAAAAGDALDAIVVSGREAAASALGRLRERSGSGHVLFASSAPRPWRDQATPPPGGDWLLAHVRAADPAVAGLLEELLGDVVLARGGFADALELALSAPGHVVVSGEGDRFSPSGWRIGSARSGATRAALDAAREALARLESRISTEETARCALVADLGEAETSLAAVHDDLARVAALATRAEQSLAESSAVLDHVAPELAQAEGDAELARRRAEEMASLVAVSERELESIEVRAQQEREAAVRAEAARHELDRRAGELAAARHDLDVSDAALSEQRSFLSTRLSDTEQQIVARRASQSDASERRAMLRTDGAALGALEVELGGVRSRVEGVRRELETERRQRHTRSAARLERLAGMRREREELERATETGRERQQRVEIELAEARVRRETLADVLRRELDVTVAEAVAAPRPPGQDGSDLSSRRRALEQELRELGPVNLLAREELAELIERSQFLEGQIEDARGARRELNQVIRAIDQEIMTIFSAAFADVATHFEHLVSTLFPGGSGQLSLTSPDDLLETGVEIEARPAGRTVRRLSLLSGGERSLVATAFLFSVFRSRPSPFYVMDEVEAALDDVNLGRFLALLAEFRREAQLLVVSHQKRTMEIADALYGVSMQPGGASKVVSERPKSSRPLLELGGPDATSGAGVERSPAHVG